MENNEIPETTPLPRVLKIISDGCNLAAGKFYLMLGPILLDLLLLFGPKLRITDYFLPIFESAYSQMMSTGPAAGGRQFDLLFDFMEQALSSFNLLGFVHTIPIGISVIFSSGSSANPLGQSAEIQLSSALQIIAIMIFILILGVFLGTVYFSVVAAASDGSGKFNIKRFGTQLLNVVLLYIALFILLFILAVPFSCVMTFTFMAAPFLYQIFMILALVFFCWILIPLFYIPHGIFVKCVDLPNAVKESFKLASWSGTITIRFLLLSMVLIFGLDMVWTIPEQSSWLVLISIFGHAFVSTALLASSFVLYRELDKWQKENRSFLEWRKANLRFMQIFKKEKETND